MGHLDASTDAHQLSPVPWRQVIAHFDGEKADLVVCDGAPDGAPAAWPRQAVCILLRLAFRKWVMPRVLRGRPPAPHMPCMESACDCGQAVPCWILQL